MYISYSDIFISSLFYKGWTGIGLDQAQYKALWLYTGHAGWGTKLLNTSLLFGTLHLFMNKHTYMHFKFTMNSQLFENEHVVNIWNKCYNFQPNSFFS